MMDVRLKAPFGALRWTYGLVPLLAGVDEFFNLLAPTWRRGRRTEVAWSSSGTVSSRGAQQLRGIA